jgi:hypothetical protein
MGSIKTTAARVPGTRRTLVPVRTVPPGRTRIRAFRGADHRIHVEAGPCEVPFSAQFFTFTFKLSSFHQVLEVEPVAGKNTAAVCRTCVVPAVDRLRAEDVLKAAEDFARLEALLELELTTLEGVKAASARLTQARELLEQLEMRDHGSTERFASVSAELTGCDADLRAVLESTWLRTEHLEELALEVCQFPAPKSSAAAQALIGLQRAAAKALAQSSAWALVDGTRVRVPPEHLSRSLWFRPGRSQVLPVALLEWSVLGLPEGEVPFVELSETLPEDVLEALDTLVTEGMDLEVALEVAQAL